MAVDDKRDDLATDGTSDMPDVGYDVWDVAVNHPKGDGWKPAGCLAMRVLATALEATIAVGQTPLDGSFSGRENSLWCNAPHRNRTVQFAICVDPEHARCLRISAMELGDDRRRESRKLAVANMPRPADGNQLGAIEEIAKILLSIATEAFPTESAFLETLKEGLNREISEHATSDGSA
jgi:hypothetical protein